MFQEIIDKFNISNIWHGNGIIISVVGYVVVFAALVFLYLFIMSLTRVLTNKQRKKLKAEGHYAADSPDISISGELNAAIATAIFLYYEDVHDIENTVLTIKKIQRPYSPWSSKLYGLREVPRTSQIK